MTVIAFSVVTGIVVVVVWLVGLWMRVDALKRIAPGLPEVFISYRRDDSEETSNRLKEFLAGQFGNNRVFLDKRTIEWGADFPTEIERYLRKAQSPPASQESLVPAMRIGVALAKPMRPRKA